jgi:pimeloyl-ACP methyl ester carboxylesterase
MPTVTVNDIPMAHEVTGRGDPLLLVAGTGYPGATWLPELVDRLAERHTVVTFDHRGTGRTPAGDNPFSTRGFAADATALLTALQLGPAHVLGHSMGGRVAQWIALDAPERVRSLILAATGPGEWRADKPVTRGVPLHTAVAMIEHGYEEYMRRHIADTFFTPEFVASDPERVAWLVEAFWAHRPDLRDYLRHVVARQEHQSADRLPDITLPALVLIGDRDRHQGGTGVHWEQSQYLAEHLPNAELAVVPDTSHGYLWQAPELSARMILEWTARH